jgi:integral membrane protein
MLRVEPSMAQPATAAKPQTFDASLGRLRAIGLAEGVSFLLLLGVAMPLKYAAGMPMAVKIAGWIHGVLFILFVLALAKVRKEHRWTNGQTAFAFVMALVPFGPFVLDARLKSESRS